MRKFVDDSREETLKDMSNTMFYCCQGQGIAHLPSCRTENEKISTIREKSRKVINNSIVQEAINRSKYGQNLMVKVL